MALAGGGYSQALAGKECLRKFAFRIDGELPPELLHQVKLAFKETERQDRQVAVEADMTVELSKIDLGGVELQPPMPGSAHIVSAKNFRLVTVNYN